MLSLEKEEITPGVEAGHRPEENKRERVSIRSRQVQETLCHRFIYPFPLKPCIRKINYDESGWQSRMG
jgi:hypothetical protein